jgi:NitT/TauT family transport system ATP-binding protein
MDAGFQSLRDRLMEQFKGTDSGLAGRQTHTEPSKDSAEHAA